MSFINVLIVDDHPVFRQGLRDVLDSDRQIHVVGEAATGEQAIEMVEELAPDVVLMDVNLPDLNGLQVTRRLKRARSALKVIVVTGYDDVEQAFHAVRAGAHAYCPKDVTPDKLRNAILSVYRGLYVVHNKEMSEEEILDWIEEMVGKATPNITTSTEDSFIPLSPREMEILEYVTRGKSNKEIALALGISHQTVKNHMTAILRKLQVDDRTQAAVYALSRGWVRVDSDFRN
jgi:DNA-binding NarL/FixJ family response regulator